MTDKDMAQSLLYDVLDSLIELSREPSICNKNNAIYCLSELQRWLINDKVPPSIGGYDTWET